MIVVSILLCLVERAHWATCMLRKPTASAIEKSKENKRSKRTRYRKALRRKPCVKSPEAKQAVDADMETMSAYGLTL